jgi:acetyl esterase/lipase
MDPATKLWFDSPLLRVYDDGRVERFYGTDTTAPGFDADTGVTSKDVVIDSATGVFARLYIPAVLLATEHKKLPILVYFHGGGLILDSAVSPMYHRYLNSVVSKASVLAVSVNYRLAPEHPVPAAYEDSWTALVWAASGADPWLSEHGNASRIFLASDSGGANIVHNMSFFYLGIDRIAIENLLSLKIKLDNLESQR